VKAACTAILTSHASTRERITILEEFYPRLFSCTGQPSVILDLACGLNPFTFPWMGLPLSTRYYAYDINRPRVALINHYFSLQGLTPLASTEDILVNPPQVGADVAFFFKEAHRFEQRQRGCNLAFWQALRVRYLLVSLPTSSLTGRHSLVDGHRKLVYSILTGQPWQVTEILFTNELVFCIDKGDPRGAGDPS
jgi:16S rRNA (guanine(1405)-N(7))-methyltransferase